MPGVSLVQGAHGGFARETGKNGTNFRLKDVYRMRHFYYNDYHIKPQENDVSAMSSNKKIKICGITAEQEIEYLAEAGVDYAGFVLFYPKSKRNISTRQAGELLRCLPERISPVAVTVSPSDEQLEAIERIGFAAVQIHGRIRDESIRRCPLPVIRAFNGGELEAFSHYEQMDPVVGFVLDAQVPGSGQAFDWSVVEQLPATEKMLLLAGGLRPENVRDALRMLGDRIDGVDTSSGVENDNGVGKSREKILALARAVRGIE